MAKPFRLTAPRALEHQEQAALFQWAAIEARRDPRLELLNASQNGMAVSSIRQAALAKKYGMKKGFPDVSLPVPAGGWHGLFIEMKRKGGVPSDVSQEQHWWIWKLLEQDYQAVVCFGWEQAVAQIQDYLGRGSSMGEQRICTPSVAGSTPALGSNFKPTKTAALLIAVLRSVFLTRDEVNVIAPQIKTETIFVTPEMANAFLEKNDGNRRLIPSRVVGYRDMILSGEFRLTHQGIALAEDTGRLLDGQHRLKGIVAANTGCFMQVSYYPNEMAFGDIDEGLPRTLAFRAGLDRAHSEVSAFLLRTSGNEGGPIKKMDLIAVTRAISPWLDLLQKVAPSRRKLMSAAPARAACVVAMIFADPVYSLSVYRKLTLGETETLPPVGHALIKKYLAGELKNPGGRELQYEFYFKFRYRLSNQ